MAWLYWRTGGSLLVTMLMHAIVAAWCLWKMRGSTRGEFGGFVK
jgi:membrane protease YdiL (CAAX protease family)